MKVDKEAARKRIEADYGSAGWPWHKPGDWSAKGLVDLICAVLESQGHEFCICAAIRLPDGRVFRGHRHGDCIRTAATVIDHRWRMGLEEGGPWSAEMCIDQGFMTSHGRYVDREEAMRLQLAAGIESVADGGYRGGQLFSEDLY